jgi:rod shape-determining protein MreD
MRWGILTAILLLLLVFEGTAFQIFSPDTWGATFALTPRFGLVVLIFISLYIGRRKAFFIGLIYGLFQDILYSDVIGVYAFAMAVIPYACALIYQYFQLNILLILITVFLGVYAHENLIFFVFHLFGLTATSYHWSDMLPTALLNGVFSVIIFGPLSSFLTGLDDARKDERRA